MDFDLSTDQLALQEAALDLVGNDKWWEKLRARVGDGTVVGTLPASVGPGETDKAATGEAPFGFDAELWAAMAEQGWLLVEQSEDQGGFGGSMVEIAVLGESIGRYLSPVPFSSSAVAFGALVSSDSPEAHLWSKEIAEGSCVAAIHWGLGNAEYSFDSSHSRLTGRFGPVLYGSSATYALLSLKEGLFGLKLDSKIEREPLSAMDRTRELSYLELKDTGVIQIGDADASVRAADRMTVALCAEMLGAASKVLEFSVEYAKDRVQFGKPIGSFQAIKHRLADALVDVEGMRSTVYYAAWALSATPREASLATSMAKSWCSEASQRVMASGLQVHGGIGFTWEHQMHLYLKRAQLDQVSCGNSTWHKDRVGQIVKERISAGESIT